MTQKLSTRRPRNWGGVITFDQLEPTTYTVKAEAFDSDGIRIGSGSIEVKVVAGETAEKTILMILTNGGEIYETNYLLFYYNNNTNKYYYADSTSEINDQIITGNNSVIAGYTEDKNGAVYQYFKSNSTADGGVMTGLTRAQAQNFAIDTIIGTASLIEESGKHPEQLKDEVCSPGGSTIAGVVSLEKNGFRNAAVQCVLDTFKRILDMGEIKEKDVV